MSNRYQFFRYVPNQLLFGLQGILRPMGQADAGGDAEYVRINCKERLMKGHRSDYIGTFSSDAREFLKLISVRGYNAIIIIAELTRHGDQVPGLVIGIGATVDQGNNIVK